MDNISCPNAKWSISSCSWGRLGRTGGKVYKGRDRWHWEFHFGSGVRIRWCDRLVRQLELSGHPSPILDLQAHNTRRHCMTMLEMVSDWLVFYPSSTPVATGLSAGLWTVPCAFPWKLEAVWLLYSYGGEILVYAGRNIQFCYIWVHLYFVLVELRSWVSSHSADAAVSLQIDNMAAREVGVQSGWPEFMLQEW